MPQILEYASCSKTIALDWRRGVAYSMVGGALGIALWLTCMGFEAHRWVFCAVFPFDADILLLAYWASNESGALGETVGVAIWLLAPLQYLLYGCAASFGVTRRMRNRILPITTACHVAAAVPSIAYLAYMK